MEPLRDTANKIKLQKLQRMENSAIKLLKLTLYTYTIN